MRKNDCIFCKIAAGEIPAHKIYEDDGLMAILDRFPVNMGHTLIIPKDHCDSLFDLPADTAARVLPLAKELAERIREKTGCDGINLIQNNGEAAGQEVRHFHLHIVPRFPQDNMMIKSRKLNPTEEEFEAFAEKIKG